LTDEPMPPAKARRRWGERSEEEREAEDRLELERWLAMGIVEFFGPGDPRITAAAGRHNIRPRILAKAVAAKERNMKRQGAKDRLREAIIEHPEMSDEGIAALTGLPIERVLGHRPGMEFWHQVEIVDRQHRPPGWELWLTRRFQPTPAKSSDKTGESA
jgi:hypothetical protein